MSFGQQQRGMFEPHNETQFRQGNSTFDPYTYNPIPYGSTSFAPAVSYQEQQPFYYQQQQQQQQQQQHEVSNSFERELTPMSEYMEVGSERDERNQEERELERYERIGDSIINAIIDEKEYLSTSIVIEMAIDIAGEPKSYKCVLDYLNAISDLISRGMISVNDKFELKYVEL